MISSAQCWSASVSLLSKAIYLTLRRLDADIAGASESSVFRQFDQPDFGIIAFDESLRAIGRGIVRNYDFQIRMRLAAQGIETYR